MQNEIELALAPLIGQPLWGPARASNMLSLQLGVPLETVSPLARPRESGGFTLHVFCPWRLIVGSQIVAGSGDLYTPADPDAELETFDWDAPGATWWDTRLHEIFAEGTTPPRVEGVAVDEVGGFRLSCSGGMVFEVFPNSSAAPHVETEHWRLFVPGSTASHLVVRADGIHRDFDA